MNHLHLFGRYGKAALISAAGLLASCAVGPNYHRPELNVPAAYKSATVAEQPPPALGADWWKLFHDDELNRLAESALAANQDIQAAIARVEGARAAVRGARGSFFPALSLEPSAQRARAPASRAGGGGIANAFSLPLDLSYEVDVWGRLRRQYEFAQYTAAASADDLAFVRQTVVADLAQAYFTIRFYDNEAGILEENLGLYREQLELTETKAKAGLALPTDVLQARTQLNTATNDLIDVRRARAKEEHAIAVLLGQPPSAFVLARQAQSPVLPAIPAGLPSELLSRRPDVARAEHRLAAANAQVGVAVAGFFPSFSLSGSVGYYALAAQHLTEWQNRVWSAGAGANLPIFQGGRLRADLAQARANYAELVAGYRTAVLTAFQDVEDQLSDLHLLAEKATSLEQTLVSAREYYRLTQLQYKQGLANYLQVINANQTLLTAEISAAQTENLRLAASVLLIKALGGGWTPGAETAKP